MQNDSKLCKIMNNCAKFCKSIHNCAKILNYAKNFRIMQNSK